MATTYSPTPINQRRLSTKEKWLGTPNEQIGRPRFDESGMNLLQQLLGGASQGLQNPYAGFEPIAQDTMRRYREDIVPSIAERFAGLNAQRSSGYEGAQGQGAERLAGQLASQQAQYGLQNRQGLLNQAALGLTPSFDWTEIQGQPGYAETYGVPALKALSSLAAFIPGLGPLIAGLGSAGASGLQTGLQGRRGAAGSGNGLDLSGLVSGLGSLSSQYQSGSTNSPFGAQGDLYRNVSKLNQFNPVAGQQMGSRAGNLNLLQGDLNNLLGGL